MSADATPLGRGSRAGVAVALSLAVVGLVVLVALPPVPSASAPTEDPRDASLPHPVAPAFVPPEPAVLAERDEASHWAPVLRRVDARSAPRADSSVVGRLLERTPEGTVNIALVIATTQDAAGRSWVHIRLPVLPNNRTGWVPRAALGGYGTTRTHLVVDRERLTATLYRRGRPVFRAGVGIGQTAWPTPPGEFYIRNRLAGFDSPAYGPLAFGTSARSDVLTDWPAGGFIGIHGTDRPDLLPGRVSHGCIRMRNEDILELGRLMPVGTPLTIR